MPNTTIGSINLMEAVETHEQAAQEATNYITDITNDGIWVTPEDAKPSNGQAVSTTTGWHISDVLEYFKAGASWIKLWVASGVAKLRLGLESSGHVVLDSNGMEVLTDASTSVASFGSTARIGAADDTHVQIVPDEISMVGSDGTEMFSVADSTAYIDTSGNVETRENTSLKPSVLEKMYLLSYAPNIGSDIEFVCKYKVSGTQYNASITFIGGTSATGAIPGEPLQVEYDASYNRFHIQLRIPQASASTFEGGTVFIYYTYYRTGGYDVDTWLLKHNGIAEIGNGAKAASAEQSVFGRYNSVDSAGAYALIIGNGTADDARSNASAITWLGEYIAQGWAGIVQMFAGAVTQSVSSGVATVTGAPAGWLLCDGSAVSRTEYATLFAAIGTTWGAGDGSTTFNLPDLRGRAAIGAGTGTSLTARTLGGTGGSEALANHDHNVASNGYNVPGKSGGWNWRTTSSGSNTNYNNTPMGGSTAAIASITKTGTAGSGSSGNMMPFSVVNFIIHTGKTS